MAEDNGNKLGPKSNFIAEVYANMETKKIVDKVKKVIKQFGNKVKEYWTNFNDNFTKFIKDWQEDILKK